MALTLYGSIDDVFKALCVRTENELIALPIVEIAKDCAWSPSTVERNITVLRAIGFIETSRPSKGVPHSYAVKVARR